MANYDLINTQITDKNGGKWNANKQYKVDSRKNNVRKGNKTNGALRLESEGSPATQGRQSNQDEDNKPGH